MRFDTGGGYIRGVMAGMKPIANDAGIRDRRAKRDTRGRTRRPTPLAWLQSATCNSEINSIGTALHNVRGATILRPATSSNDWEFFLHGFRQLYSTAPLARLTRRWLDLSNFPGKRMFRSVEAGGGCRNDSNESISCFLDRDTIEEKRKRT